MIKELAQQNIASVKLFLSCSEKDKELRVEFDHQLTQLKQEGHIEIRGRHTIEAGEDKEKIAIHLLQTSQLIILLISPDFLASDTTYAEMQHAIQFHKAGIARVIALLLRPTDWKPDPTAKLQVLPRTGKTIIESPPLDRAFADIAREIRLIVERLPGTPFPQNPYKGLEAFRAEDARYFFGRDRLIDELVRKIHQILATAQQGKPAPRLLTVIGPSGSGKSSVVMAGLLPELKEGAIRSSADWIYLNPITPGKQPIERLKITLSPLFPTRTHKSLREDLEAAPANGLHSLLSAETQQSKKKVLLVVDQFEELFTLTVSEKERRQFIDLLLTAVSEPDGPLIVIITLRADFYDRPMQASPALAELIQRCQVIVTPMELADLRAAIEEPAQLTDVQLTFEDGLVNDLLFNVRGQTGALPLLAFTLHQLFEKRVGQQLTWDAYRELGGVEGAITKHADNVYHNLPAPEYRTMARWLFLRLIKPGATEQDAMRDRVPFSQLTMEDAKKSALVSAVADAFIKAGLLTSNKSESEATLEMSHEVLIREWTSLTEWLRTYRYDTVLQKAISNAASDWLSHDKDPAYLIYAGSRLAEALGWQKRNDATDEEAEFLSTCADKEQDQEQKEKDAYRTRLFLQEKATRRLRVIVAILGIFLIVGGTLAIYAEILRESAVQAELKAISQKLAADAAVALSQDKLDLALLLSAQSYQVNNTYEARNSLLQALQKNTYIVKKFYGEKLVRMLAFSADGTSLISVAVTAASNELLISSLKDGKQARLTLPESEMIPVNAAFGASTQSLALANRDGVWLRNITSNHTWHRLAEKTSQLPSNYLPVAALAFSPDGKVLAVGRCDQANSADPYNPFCTKSTILLWDVLTQRSITTITMQSSVNDLEFNANGTLVAIATAAEIQLRQVPTGVQLNYPTLPRIGETSNIAFSARGNLLVYGSKDGSVHLWNMAAGSPMTIHLPDQTQPIHHVAFSPDGSTLAWSNKSQVTVRRVGSEQSFPLTGDQSDKTALAFSPDGKMLAAGSGNNILLWNLQQQSPISQYLVSVTDSSSVLFTPDGKHIAIGNNLGQILFYDMDTKKYKQFDTAAYHDNKQAAIQSLAISADGQTLASGNTDGFIMLWDLHTGQMKIGTQSLAGLPGMQNIFLSADGHLLAASDEKGTIQLWDMLNYSMHTIRVTSPSSPRVPTALSPDGRLLAVGVCGKQDASGECTLQWIQLWDTVTQQSIGTLTTGDTETTLAVAFAPSGNTLAASNINRIIVWKLTAGQPSQESRRTLSDPNPTSNLFANSNLAFSTDGQTLVSYSSPHQQDFRYKLWSIATYEALAQDITIPGAAGSIALSGSGQHLVSLSSSVDQQIVLLWDTNVADWPQIACRIANRTLTPDELRQYGIVALPPHGCATS